MTINTAIVNLNHTLRHNWTVGEVMDLFHLPFNDLLHRAQSTHRAHFNPNEVQLSTLLSIKTGGCPENCAYCPQSAHFETEVKASKLMATEEILQKAQQAKQAGASRFCMGAAWRSPKDRDIPEIANIVREVKSLGLETCMTLGMISSSQAQALKEAGLDYYNHNIDTSEEYYSKIITTRTFQDRLDTLDNVRNSGMKVCCGGIVGMGENVEDRAKMLLTLANLPEHPESVPINRLVTVEGTPLQNQSKTDIFDFIRTIAVARIMMPKSFVRLSAGREDMTEEAQALCFHAGANSIFYGETLLTTPNPKENLDLVLMEKLGIEPLSVQSTSHSISEEREEQFEIA